MASDVDRSKLPEPGDPPRARFVELQRDTLSNGLQLILAERHETPIVNLNLVVDAGYAADRGSAPGTARLTMDMLDEGTATLSALEISEQAALLGARSPPGRTSIFRRSASRRSRSTWTTR